MDKLKEASKSVAQLSKDLEVKEKELEIASRNADKVHLTISLQSFTRYAWMEMYKVMCTFSTKRHKSK